MLEMAQVEFLPVLSLEPTVFPFPEARRFDVWAVDVDFGSIIQSRINMHYELFLIEKSFLWLGNSLWLFLLFRQVRVKQRSV